MIDLRFIDEVTRKLAEALPPGITQAKDELEAQFRSILEGAFGKMNLVSRKEYEEKCGQLEEARERLEALEERLVELESN